MSKTEVKDVSLEEAIVEEDQAASDNGSEESVDIIDTLVPKAEPATWVIGAGEEKREYVQKPLSFFGKMQFFSLVGEVVDKALSGDDAMTIGHLFDAPAARGGVLSAQDFKEADTFLQAISKLTRFAPDFLKDCYCVWLNIPDYERLWAKDVMDLPPEEGGLSDDDGIEIIEVFIDQNWGAIEDFFRNKIGQIRNRVELQRKQATEKKSASSKQSKITRRTTRKR